MNREIFEGFLKRYELHPLLVLRTMEYTKSLGEAFDLLEEMSSAKSYVWSSEKNCWVEKKLQEEKFFRKWANVK